MEIKKEEYARLIESVIKDIWNNKWKINPTTMQYQQPDNMSQQSKSVFIKKSNNQIQETWTHYNN